MAPTWRQLFDSWEKAVAPGLEEMTASTEFRDAMATVTKLSAAARRQVEQASRQVLHSMNLPTASDIRKLRRQISQLEDEVANLRRAAQKATGQPTTNRRAKLAAIDDAIAAAANGQTSGATGSTGKTGVGSIRNGGSAGSTSAKRPAKKAKAPANQDKR